MDIVVCLVGLVVYSVGLGFVIKKINEPVQYGSYKNEQNN